MFNKTMLALMVISVSTPVMANSGFGICDFGAVKLPNIVCTGPAFLKQTQITGDTKITGSMQAYNVNAQLMSVTGSVDINSSNVNGQMIVVGNMKAYHTEFMKSIDMTGNSLILDKSIVRGEVKVNSATSKPVIKMTCGAGVAGSVNFTGKEGVVQVTGDSVVKGKVINGTLEFIEEECES